MTKSVITIEKEFYSSDDGTPMVRRIVKEDGITYHDESGEVSRLFAEPAVVLNRLDNWLMYRKDPDYLDSELGIFMPDKDGNLVKVSDVDPFDND